MTEMRNMSERTDRSMCKQARWKRLVKEESFELRVKLTRGEGKKRIEENQ